MTRTGQMSVLENDMINVSHKIKCTHKGTPTLCYIKTADYKLGMRTITSSLGKADEWHFSQIFTAMIQNNYVQTARSLK